MDLEASAGLTPVGSEKGAADGSAAGVSGWSEGKTYRGVVGTCGMIE